MSSRGRGAANGRAAAVGPARVSTRATKSCTDVRRGLGARSEHRARLARRWRARSSRSRRAGRLPDERRRRRQLVEADLPRLGRLEMAILARPTRSRRLGERLPGLLAIRRHAQVKASRRFDRLAIRLDREPIVESRPVTDELEHRDHDEAADERWAVRAVSSAAHAPINAVTATVSGNSRFDRSNSADTLPPIDGSAAADADAAACVAEAPARLADGVPATESNSCSSCCDGCDAAADRVAAGLDRFVAGASCCGARGRWAARRRASRPGGWPGPCSAQTCRINRAMSVGMRMASDDQRPRIERATDEHRSQPTSEATARPARRCRRREHSRVDGARTRRRLDDQPAPDGRAARSAPDAPAHRRSG